MPTYANQVSCDPCGGGVEAQALKGGPRPDKDKHELDAKDELMPS